MIKNTKKAKGFTLVEILFALFIGLLLLGTIYVSMISGQRSSAALEDKIVAQQDARAALELMAMEIGMASYNPLFTSPSVIWTGGPSINKGIQEVAGFLMSNAIRIQMDINEDENVTGPNETIIYIYDTIKQYITRNTGGGNQPFLGDDPVNPRSVRVINNTLNIPMFRYFNGMGVEIPAASLPAGIPNIRRIEITLAVETQDFDPMVPGATQGRRMIYSTSVITRNHAINL